MPRTRQQQGQAEILEAAASFVAEHGYHGMSMRALAKATGQSLGNLYNYFPSKDALLWALQSRAFETLIASARLAVGSDADAEGRLYAFILNHVRYVASHPDAMRVLVHEAGALPAPRRRSLRRLKQRYYELGAQVVRDVVQDGCAQPGAVPGAVPVGPELERLTYNVFGMLNWVYGWYDPERHGEAQDVARSIHSLTLCGLVARRPSRSTQAALERHVAGRVVPSPLDAIAQGGRA